MILETMDLPLAIALTPVAGAIAAQQLWSRLRDRADLKTREERAEAARREALSAMETATREAQRAQRSRDEFLSRMSHELRTPLNAVIGFARVLESNRAGNQRPEDIRMLQRVRASGEELLRLLEDVLEQSRIARGNLTVETSEVDVASIAGRVVARYARAAAAKGLRLQGTLPALPERVRLDPGHLEHVLEHLIENAIKFTGAGSVTVELVADEAGRPESLIVADTGIGIPMDRLEEIFQPFQQVDTSASRSYGGAGLGLPLARELCVAMNCGLTVASEPGRGSRFIVTFPGRGWHNSL